MWSLVVILLAGPLVLELTEGLCDKQEEIYYNELGCRPGETDKDGCATSYDCSSIRQRSKQQCHYKGRAYTSKEKLENNPMCVGDCYCSEDAGRYMFTCASVECPELFEGPPKEGCYRLFDHDNCCSVGEICEDEAASKTPRASCTYDGVTYKEGQKFYPDEHHCMKCICQPGFNGTVADPFCRQFECDLELHYGDHIEDGCVPVYYGTKGCCPIDWRCPEKSDSVVKMSNTNNTNSAQVSGNMCEFGKLKLQVGDMLNTKDKNRKCVCQVPPQPLCFQDESS